MSQSYSQITAKARLARTDVIKIAFLMQKSSSLVGLFRHAGREMNGHKIGREGEG